MHCCHVLGGLSMSLLLMSLAPLDAAADVVEVVVIDTDAVVMVEDNTSNADAVSEEDTASCCGVGLEIIVGACLSVVKVVVVVVLLLFLVLWLSSLLLLLSGCLVVIVSAESVATALSFNADDVDENSGYPPLLCSSQTAMFHRMLPN